MMGVGLTRWVSGRPGRLPAQALHRSGRAESPHPALQAHWSAARRKTVAHLVAEKLASSAIRYSFVRMEWCQVRNYRVVGRNHVAPDLAMICHRFDLFQIIVDLDSNVRHDPPIGPLRPHHHCQLSLGPNMGAHLAPNVPIIHTVPTPRSRMAPIAHIGMNGARFTHLHLLDRPPVESVNVSTWHVSSE